MVAMVLAKTVRTTMSAVDVRIGCESAGSSDGPGAWCRRLASGGAVTRWRGRALAKEGEKSAGDGGAERRDHCGVVLAVSATVISTEP